MDSATVTIHDDDAPRVSLFLDQGGSIAEINEDNSWVVGPVKARVTTKGGGPLPEELRVGWRPEGGSAVPNEDYAANPLYATTFPQGAPSGTELDIGAGIVYQDAVLEPDESFNVGLLASGQLSSSGIYSTDPSPISIVIKDDDTSPPLKLHTISPCRLLDASGTSAFSPNEDRAVQVTGLCGIPPLSPSLVGPRAIALTITVVNQAVSGHLRIHPQGTQPGPASVINFATGDVISSNVHFFLDPQGRINIYCFQAAHTPTTRVIVDVTGYFE
jgi:hypothetical protein